MKTTITKSFLFMAIIFFAGSCSESAESKRENDYKSSYNQWLKLKNTNGDSYEYQTTYSYWSGTKSQTTIRVENGEVTARSFIHTAMKRDGQGVIIDIDTLKVYHENAHEIGSNEQGASPYTIDELYDSCIRNYLKVDEKKNEVYFETNGDGTLNMCGFTPNNCQDDCYQGISIDTIIWLK